MDTVRGIGKMDRILSGIQSRVPDHAVVGCATVLVAGDPIVDVPGVQQVFLAGVVDGDRKGLVGSGLVLHDSVAAESVILEGVV